MVLANPTCFVDSVEIEWKFSPKTLLQCPSLKFKERSGVALFCDKHNKRVCPTPA